MANGSGTEQKVTLTEAIDADLMAELAALAPKEELGDWVKLGLCGQTDPEAFHPEKGGSTQAAKRVCQACVVRGECLQNALANDEQHGVRGGLTIRERRKLKQQWSNGRLAIAS